MSNMDNVVIHRTTHGRIRRVVNKPEPVLASRDKILGHARELMRNGNLRPDARALCTGIITDAAINRHFETMSALYQAALEDNHTRGELLALLMPNGLYPSSDDCDRIFRAIFTGRLAR